MIRSQEEWITAYKEKGGLWIHDGNPKRPHALLTSGAHSDGFFNSRKIIPDEKLLLDAALDLLELFVQKGGEISVIDGVVGPQTGATKLSELISSALLSVYKKEMCFWASPAKHEENGVKSMVFMDQHIPFFFSPQRILPCEDVLTTGSSVTLAIDAVRAHRSTMLPFVLVLVNRSGLSEVEGKKIIALIDRPMPMWKASDCPLCKAGSDAIPAKDNWDKLNANY